jgi:hypothetical protein
MKKAFAAGESIEFAGKAIAHLAADPAIMAKTGKILQTVDLAHEYGFQVPYMCHLFFWPNWRPSR